MKEMTKEGILKKMKTKGVFILRIRKTLKFLGCVTRKEGLKNLTLKGHVEIRKGRGIK